MLRTVSGVHCQPTYTEISKALVRADRPVRIHFQRPAQLLQAIPTQLPLLLWHGSASLTVNNNSRQQSSGGSYDEVVSSPLSLELISDPVVRFRIVFRWSVLPNVVFHPTKIHTKASQDLQSNEDSGNHKLVFSVKGKFTSAVSCNEIFDLERCDMGFYQLNKRGTARPDSFELVMDDLSSHITLQKLIPCHFFPTEVAFQTHGFVGPRVLLEGLLDKWETPVITGEWRTFWFRLRSDGSLQWFLPELYYGKSEQRNKFIPYPHRPRGGVCVSKAVISMSSRHVAKISRLKAEFLQQMCAFSIETEKEKLVLRPGTTEESKEEIRKAWMDAIVRDKQLSNLLRGQPSSSPRQAKGDMTPANGETPARRMDSSNGTPEPATRKLFCSHLLSDYDNSERSIEYLYRFLKPVTRSVHSPFLQTLEGLQGTKDKTGTELQNANNAPFERFTSPLPANPDVPVVGQTPSRYFFAGSSQSSVAMRQLNFLFGKRKAPSNLDAILEEALEKKTRQKLEMFSTDPETIFQHPSDVFYILVQASYELDNFFYVKQHLPPIRDVEEIIKEHKIPFKDANSCDQLVNKEEVSLEPKTPNSVFQIGHSLTPLGDARVNTQNNVDRSGKRNEQETNGRKRKDSVASSISSVKHVSSEKNEAQFLRRHHFIQLAGRYLGPLCDQYSAGAVFDALVDDTLPVSFRVRAMLNPSGADVNVVNDFTEHHAFNSELPLDSYTTFFENVTAEDMRVLYHVQQSRRYSIRRRLHESWLDPANRIDRFERVLTVEPFVRYVSSVEKSTTSQHSGWDQLRWKLDLSSSELCTRVEEYMNMFLTLRIEAPRKSLAEIDKALQVDALFSAVYDSNGYLSRSSSFDLSIMGDGPVNVRIPWLLALPAEAMRKILLELPISKDKAANMLAHTLQLIRRDPSSLLTITRENLGQSDDHAKKYQEDILSDYRMYVSPLFDTDEAEPMYSELSTGGEGKYVTGSDWQNRVEDSDQRQLSTETSHSKASNSTMDDNHELDSDEQDLLDETQDQEKMLFGSDKRLHKNDRKKKHIDSDRFLTAIANFDSKGYDSVRISGTMYITDQNLFLLPNKQEALVFPLRSVTNVDYCKIETNGMRGDDDCGLHLRSCEVRRLGLSASEERTQVQGFLSAASKVACSSIGSLTPSQRKQWLQQVIKFICKFSKMQEEVFKEIFDHAANVVGHNRVHRTPISKRKYLTRGHDGQIQVCKKTFKEALPSVTPIFGAILSCINSSCSGTIFPSATLIFSHMKDTLLTRGEERAGGRRRVVAEILNEMLSAFKIRHHHPILCSSNTAREGARAIVDRRIGRPRLSSVAGENLLKRWKASLERDIEEDNMFERRLNIWAAMNVLRTRALLKATGRCVTSLLQCTEYYSYYQQLLKNQLREGHSTESYVRLPSGGTVSVNPLKALQYWVFGLSSDGSTGEFTKIRGAEVSRETDKDDMKDQYRNVMESKRDDLWKSALNNSPALIQFLCEQEPKWLIRTVTYVCHADDLEYRRKNAFLSFSLQNLRRQLVQFSQHYIRSVNVALEVRDYILSWTNPLLTLSLFILLLLLPWYDLMPYSVPISIFAIAGILLFTGSVLDSGFDPFLQFMETEESKRYGMVERVERVRQYTTKFITYLYDANEFMEKMKALVTWKDPPSTRVFVVALILVGLVCTVVPSRYLFTGVVLQQFTKTFRNESEGLARLAWKRLYRKLPVPSESSGVYYPIEKKRAMTTESEVLIIAPGIQRNVPLLRGNNSSLNKYST